MCVFVVDGRELTIPLSPPLKVSISRAEKTMEFFGRNILKTVLLLIEFFLDV